jgi:hypothetical protein
MAFFFGKSIEFVVRLMNADDKVVEPYALVNARVYADVPTSAQEQDSDGSDGGFEGTAKTTWTSLGDYKYQITFDAIDDPDYDSGALYDQYYVVVNFRLESGEYVHNLVKSILVWRVVGQISHIDVNAGDMLSIDSVLGNIYGEVELQQKIDAATDEVLRKVRFMKLRRDRLEENDLSGAVLYKALELAFLAASGRNNDYELKASQWAERFKTCWAETQPGYDAGDTGTPVPANTQTPIFQQI